MAESKAQNISSQLWAIANDLRGTMDASSFKDYILPFLFYKYLSIHQEDYLVLDKIYTYLFLLNLPLLKVPKI